jgi:hypothetical protein
MKYQPNLPPKTAEQLGQYIYRELVRIAQRLQEPEATTVNYGLEYRNVVAKDDTTYTLSWRNGQKQLLSLANSATVSVGFDAPSGVCNVMLRVVHSGAGRKFTLPSTVKWTGGTIPTWSVSSSAVDVMAMYYDGTNYHATASVNSK